MQITHFKMIDKGYFRSQVSILIPKWGNFFINGIKVFEKEDRRWIIFPSFEFEKDGAKKFSPHCGFDSPEMADAFRRQFFVVYDEYMKKREGNLDLFPS